jgi:hypothetical protein
VKKYVLILTLFLTSLILQAKTLEQEEQENCSICLDGQLTKEVTLPCTHTYHKVCIKQWFAKKKTFICPLCKTTYESLPYPEEPEPREDLEALKRKIADATDLEQKDEDGYTLLHECVFHQYSDGIEELLHRGADINVTSKLGLAPLHIAALFGYYDEVKQLLAWKADAWIRDKNGKTAADLAHKHSRKEVCNFIEQKMKIKKPKKRDAIEMVAWAAAIF